MMERDIFLQQLERLDKKLDGLQKDIRELFVEVTKIQTKNRTITLVLGAIGGVIASLLTLASNILRH